MCYERSYSCQKYLSKRAIKGFWSKQVTMPCADKDAANNPKTQAAKPSQQCMLHHAFLVDNVVSHMLTWYLLALLTTAPPANKELLFHWLELVAKWYKNTLSHCLIYWYLGEDTDLVKKNSLSRDQKLENECEKLVDQKCEQCMYHMYPFPYTQILSVLLNITQQATCSHYRNTKFRNSTVHHSHDRAFLHWKVNLSLFIPFPPKVENSSSPLPKRRKKRICLPHPRIRVLLGESWLEPRERAHPKTKCWPLWLKRTMTVKAQLCHKKSFYAISKCTG